MLELEQLEQIATELIRTFDIETAPVPIEIMLQRPKSDMWDEVDITELSVGFLKKGDHYSPRMSLARLLARHITQSVWGKQRGMSNILEKDTNEEILRAFARMLIMPSEMVRALSDSGRTHTNMSIYFEVPEEDARLRLEELANNI